MKKVVTFGEIMLRLSTNNYEKIVQANNFKANYGGGEANVAVSLASLGVPAKFVTKVPDNAVGESAIGAVRKFGVETDCIVKGEGRLGIYFLEPGVSLRNSNVIYDRKNSAISLAKPEEFEFDKIFDEAGWFHMSGITPALSEEAFILSKRFLEEAKKRNIKVSFDINYRSKLWTMKKASMAMKELAPYVDVCFGSIRDMREILGVEGEDSNIYENACEKYGFSYIVDSERITVDATHNKYSAKIYATSQKEIAKSRQYDIDNIVDRVGGGDALAAGVICRLYSDFDNFRQAIEFGVAASVLKHTIQGDYNVMTVSEVEAFVNTSASAEINR